jgi:hypothetical protein
MGRELDTQCACHGQQGQASMTCYGDRYIFYLLERHIVHISICVWAYIYIYIYNYETYLTIHMTYVRALICP